MPTIRVQGGYTMKGQIKPSIARFQGRSLIERAFMSSQPVVVYKGSFVIRSGFINIHLNNKHQYCID
jgi:hypothetical protein